MKEPEKGAQLASCGKDAKHKNLLIISSSYPPYLTLGGKRISKLAQYLLDFGWRSTVITMSGAARRWVLKSDSKWGSADVKVIQVPFHDFIAFMDGISQRLGLTAEASSMERCMENVSASPESGKSIKHITLSVLRWIKRWVAFPDPYIYWFPSAFACCLRELNNKRYHGILSTSPPNSCHVLGAALAAVAGLPWVADFRDPWSHNVYRMTSLSPARQKAERECEKRLMRRACAMVTVSESLAEDLRCLHGDMPGGIHCITGGFDSDYRPPGIQPQRDKFIITYAGSLYDLKRNPIALLEVVDKLVKEGTIGKEKILVRFYGPYEPTLSEVRDKLAFPEVVELNGVITPEEAAARLAESTIVVVLQWSDPYDEKIYGGKVFELMGVGRPVIALTSHRGLLANLIKRTGIGRVCENKEEIESTLRDWIAEFEARGCVGFTGKAEELEPYRWDKLAGRLACVLDSVCATAPTPRLLFGRFRDTSFARQGK